MKILSKKIIEAARKDGSGLFRIPGILCLDNGTVILYYECRKGESDWSEIDIGIRISYDGGETFSDRRILAASDGDTVNNPIMVEKDGRIHFFYCRNYSRVFYSFSDDNAENFSSGREITAEIRSSLTDSFTVIATGPGHGIVLENGRIFVPVWTAENHDNPKAHHPSRITALVSDDDGRSFRLTPYFDSGTIDDPNEYSVVQTADKVVFLNVRNESSLRFRAVAYGDGESFTTLKLNRCLRDPVCMSGAVYADGKIFLSGCTDSTERKNLTVRVSADNGKTFDAVLHIEDDASYSDIAFQKAAGRLLVFYESDDCEYLKLAVIG